MIVEPQAGDRVEDNLNPVGRAYYAFSTMLCTPNSLSQNGRLALGAQAGEARLREVVTAGGFTRFRRPVQHRARGAAMIVTLTARRLKPGLYDTFRAAWDPGHAPTGWTRIYHCRDISDPDVVISFGLLDGTLEQLRDAQQRLARGAQVKRIDPHVHEVLLDGSYEVVEELSP